MDYFDDPRNVDQYIEMVEGFDGRALIPHLRRHVPDGATLLEIGMGPGQDLALLADHYQVAGSDRSALFVDRYRAANPKADILQLDASALATNRRFDAIYSNKVLHLLTRAVLPASLIAQTAVLNPNGHLFHTFWRGEQEETHRGMQFVYWTEDLLRPLLPPDLAWVEAGVYSELGPDDSFYVVLHKTTTTNDS